MSMRESRSESAGLFAARRREDLTAAPESPIEWKLYDALRTVASYDYGFDVLGHDRGLGEPVAITPQVQIGSCRVDLLVSASFGSKCIKIVIECDGHEFHERTKMQASRDKRRDR